MYRHRSICQVDGRTSYVRSMAAPVELETNMADRRRRRHRRRQPRRVDARRGYRTNDQPPRRDTSRSERRPTARGNTEGTPPRARASTAGYSSSFDSFFLRGFRARGFPVVPAAPSSLLDGKEGVDGSSPSEGFEKRLQISGSLETCVASVGDTGGRTEVAPTG